MKFPSLLQILEIHHKSLVRFGGEKGILHKNQLIGLVDSMKQAQRYGNKDTIALAAWILVTMVQNHYFVDGNKRTALGTTLNFLRSNNCSWNLPYKQFFLELTMEIAKERTENILEDVENKLQEVITCE